MNDDDQLKLAERYAAKAVFFATMSVIVALLALAYLVWSRHQ